MWSGQGLASISSVCRGAEQKQCIIYNFGLKKYIFKPKTSLGNPTPEFYFGIFFLFLRLVEPEVLVGRVQLGDQLAEHGELVAQQVPELDVRLVEGLVVSDEGAVVGREPERVLALLVALLLRLVRLVLEAVVVVHLLPDVGPDLLEGVESEGVGHDEEQLAAALLDVLDRLVEVVDVVDDVLDQVVELVSLLDQVVDGPRSRGRRVQLG